MLQGLVVIHVLGVIVESVKAKDSLLPAMFTGSKRRRADEPGEDAKRASLVALAVALPASIAASFALMTQPTPASTWSSPEINEGHIESEDH